MNLPNNPEISVDNAPKKPLVGMILKIAIFATGCSGIVAEFVLSTLATYLCGNAVFQWTIVMSLMLFAMGVGSRVSKTFRSRLLDVFILTEFLLSALCASSAVFSYGLAAFTTQINLVIYFLALVIGGLIGLEIPLVTRINQDYEEMRTNIAMVMEKDYYGSLIGGLFFAFVALPHLGLTYTPVVLGSINFLVASILMWSFFGLVRMKKAVIAAFCACALFLSALGFFAKPIILFGEQKQYKDKVILAEQTVYQRIVMTQWRDHYWLFINGQEQFSSYDEERYHEPLAHPAMTLAASRSNVLILGGGDGMALREIWKYPDVKSVTMVDLDKGMTDLATNHPILKGLNQQSMSDPRLTVVHRDALKFLRETEGLFGVIVIDLPDPDSVDLMHLYAVDFYRMAEKHLERGGALVTQATSPYFSPKAFRCIIKTLQAAGFTTMPYHNPIPTMGEWGWVLAVRDDESDEKTLKKRVLALDLDRPDTRFLNSDAMTSMAYFGKGVLDKDKMDEVRPNSQFNPVLHQYYLAGKWAVY